MLEHFGNVSLAHLGVSWPGEVLWRASSTPGHSHGTVALAGDVEPSHEKWTEH